MALKEILDKIQSALPADADSSLTSLLADAKREATVVLSDLSSANKEAQKYREELKAEKLTVETVKADLDKLSAPDAEIQRLKKIESEYLAKVQADNEAVKNTWLEKAKTLAVDKTSKLYEKAEKVKADFKGLDKPEELTIDDIKANLERFSLLEKTGYFAEPTTDTGGNAPNRGTDAPLYSSSGAAIAAQLGYK
jgi:hypothetical protein